MGFLDFSEIKAYKLPEGDNAFDDSASTTEEDTATIVYTSGTTGDPKGAVLSHRNIIFNAISAVKRFHVTPDDVFLSFLPLCHIFERVYGYYTILYKSEIKSARAEQT